MKIIESTTPILKALIEYVSKTDGPFQISLDGIGLFEIRYYEPYEGRNPRTGQVVHVPGKRIPAFRNVSQPTEDEVTDVKNSTDAFLKWSESHSLGTPTDLKKC